jgi:glycosyltransferase involved in cell wall biosynthesis
VRHFALISGLGYGFGRETLRQRFLSLVMSALYKLSLKRSDGVIFQNSDDEALFIARGLTCRDKTSLVAGSGVNLAQFSPAPLPDQPVFLLMARLIPEKGVREYVAASKLVRKEIPEARFLLAGWVESRRGAITTSELESWREEGVIEYLGVLEDVRPALAQAAVYVLPSYYREGVPRSALEALSMGRAIITTDLPGCRETVVPDENGMLVKPRDPDGLANAMMRLARSAPRRSSMGAASRRLAERRFATEHVNAAMLKSMGL